jgi:hypothetical protein
MALNFWDNKFKPIKNRYVQPKARIVHFPTYDVRNIENEAIYTENSKYFKLTCNKLKN